jgi:hypothetical protein
MMLGLIVEDFDERHFPKADTSPVATLCFDGSMSSFRSAPSGKPGVMSEIRGKRELNVRQGRRRGGLMPPGVVSAVGKKPLGAAFG